MGTATPGEGRGAQLDTAVDRGLQEAKGTGVGRVPSAPAPPAQCTNALGPVRRLKGCLDEAQRWAQGAQLAQQSQGRHPGTHYRNCW